MSKASKIVVVGLGYVGLPLAVALAATQEVVGFDIDASRIDELKRGHDRTREVAAEALGATTLALAADPASCVGADIGAFLRRRRIDELPQIINILKSEMSWIGPRPEALVLSNWYTGEIPFYRYRHVLRPGISGWAQVSQGHVADVDEVHEKLQYDFFYIKYFSSWLDLLILLRTVKTMLTGFGSR